MILTDAGPLVALIDRDEPDHDCCRVALTTLTGPMVTTWPAFTEAIYLLGSAAGWHGQAPLWRLLLRGDLQLADLDEVLINRSYALMEKYRDVPMDLADATLVAIAEARSITQIFTLDADFQVYRLRNKQVFQIVPVTSEA
jgi:predicted nucleic acid-binding protein